MPDTETTLTPDQVAEIEARRWVHSYGDERLEADESTRTVLLKVAERDALCASLRAAWAEHDTALARVVKFNDLSQSHAEQLASARQENAALRTQNQTQAESITYFQENEKKLRAQLAQVEQERDRAREDLRNSNERQTYSIMSEDRQRETVTFTKEVARELEWGSDTRFEVVENVLYDNSRWALHYRMTIKRKSDGRFFQATYRRGATESQDEGAFENTDPVFNEVFPVQKTVTVYE